MFSFRKISNSDDKYEVLFNENIINNCLAEKDEPYLKSSKTYNVITENRLVGETLIHCFDENSYGINQIEVNSWLKTSDFILNLIISRGHIDDLGFIVKFSDKWNFPFSFKEYRIEFSRLQGEDGISIDHFLVGRNEIEVDVSLSYHESIIDAVYCGENLILNYHKRATNELTKDSLNSIKHTEFDYDFFISHASEDKASFVRPLAEKLTKAGFKVWYDEFQLKVGDKLRRSIDKGLTNSRFGIVVFSPDFFKKNWTQYELDALVHKEMTGEKAIIPLWHKVSKDEVMKFSPSLADTVALNTAMFTLDELVEKLSNDLK